jgi:hypothetical protein
MNYANDPLDQTQTLPPRPKMPLGRVVLINFALMLAYFALTGVGKGDMALGSLMTDAMLLVAQVAINFIGGLVLLFTERKELGRAMIIASILVGIIGFGVCMGKYAAFG